MPDNALKARAFLFAGAAIAALIATPAVAAEKQFSIAPQDLSSALKAFGRQSGETILYQRELTGSVRSSGAVGKLEPGDALSRILRGSRFQFHKVADGFVIVPVKPADEPALLIRTLVQTPSTPVAPAAPTWAEAVAVEEIVVTGSRAVTNGNAAPTPVTVIGRDQLNLSAPTSVADALAQVPEFRSSSRPSSFVTPQTVTGAFLSLRGLGQNRTLTLLDGRRVTPTTADGRVDVNTFPDLLIKRVDVVTGGASAAYGTDAVAGVVNFVIDGQFEGVKVDVGAGVSGQGDNQSYKARIAAGTSLLGGRLHLVGSFDYFDSKGVLASDGRDWDTKHCNVIQNPTFATDGRTAFLFRCNVTGSQYATGGVITAGPLRGTQFLAGGAPAPFTYGAEVSAATMVGGDGYWNPRGNISTPIETATAFGRATYDVSPRVRLWGEAGYSRTKSHFFGTSPAYSAGTAITVYEDNAFLDAVTRARLAASAPPPANGAARSFSLGRIAPDWGRSIGRTDTETYRVATGFQAELGRSWIVDGSLDLGHTYTHQENDHSPNQTRLFEALDAVVNPATGQAVCRSALVGANDGCAPLNPFGYGSASPASLAYVFQDGYADNYVNQVSGELNLRGAPFKTWAGDVALAVGVSGRDLDARIDTDPLSLAPIVAAPNTRGYPATLINKIGVFLTGNFVNQPKARITVKEVFAEAQVPLARDAPLLKALDVNAAVRYADYSTTGGVVAWKVGGSWEPVDWLRLRVTRSRDVRAPNIPELYQPPQAQLGAIIDNRTGVSNNLPQYFVGNASLQTEIANTLTVGAVFRPKFLSGFSASLDYYDLKINNAVGQLPGQNIVNLCAKGGAEYCQFVNRLADGTLASVTIAYLNQNVLVDRGVDFETNYTFDLGPVRTTLRGLVSYLDTLATTDAFGAVLEAAGVNGGELVGTPRWQGSSSVTLAYKGFSAFVQARYIGDGLYSNLYVVGGRASNSIDYNHVPARTYVDLTLRQRLKATGNPEIYLTVNNLFDVDPPPAPTRIGAPASILGTNPTLYDVVGRQFNIGARFSF